MTQTWIMSDPHFGHRNIITFKDDEGNLVRPFSSAEEMDEIMIERHNKVVKPADKVYCLGDVAMNRSQIQTIGKLNGRKVLIKGNHDIFKLKDYIPYFDDIRAYKVFPEHRMIMSHIPVHTSQLEHRFKWNVHGHLHQNLVKAFDGLPDTRYINVCMEHTNFAPVNFEDLLKRIGYEKNST